MRRIRRPSHSTTRLNNVLRNESMTLVRSNAIEEKRQNVFKKEKN